jgi:hypothetical protein
MMREICIYKHPPQSTNMIGSRVAHLDVHVCAGHTLHVAQLLSVN